MDIIINSNGKINQIPQEKEAATPTLPIDFEDGSVDAILAQMSDDNKSEDRPLAEQLLDEVERKKQDASILEPIYFDERHYGVFKEAVSQLSKKINFNDAETIQHLMDLGFDRSEITSEKADLTRLTWDEDEDGNTLPTLHNHLLRYAEKESMYETVRRDLTKEKPIDKQIIPMSKIALALINETNLFLTGKASIAPYSRNSKKKNIRTLLEVKVPDKWIADGITNLTYIEFLVLIIISTMLYKYNPRCFTITTIYKIITLDDDAEPSDQMKEAIQHIIEDVLMEIKVTIDASQEFRSITGNLDDEFKEVNRRLVNLRIRDVKVNGKRIRAYYFLEPPIMYEYSNLYLQDPNHKLTGLFMVSKKEDVQIHKLSNKKSGTQVLWDIMNNTLKTIGGNVFLRMKLYAMNKKDGSFSIDDYYKAVGDDPGTTSRVVLQRDREFLESMLMYYKAIGKILDFESIKDGNHFIKVNIKLSANSK